MDFNSVVVMGRLAADPEFTKGEKQDGSDDRCWARLAINRPTKEDKADFVPLCAWGSRARVMAQYGKKGKGILVRGSLRTNNKQRPDGSYDNYTEVSVAEITLGPKSINKNTANVAIPEVAAIPHLTPEIVATLQAQLTQLMGQEVPTHTADNPFQGQA